MSPGDLRTLFLIGVPALTIVVIAVALVWRTHRPGSARAGRFPYWSRQKLLTAGELAFWLVLKRALRAGHEIAPKVRLADLIGCNDADWERGYGKLIGNKHVDFVVIDSTNAAILFAIELDDRSHERPERQARDEFLDRALAAAKVRLVRIRAASSYDARKIAEAMYPR